MRISRVPIPAAAAIFNIALAAVLLTCTAGLTIQPAHAQTWLVNHMTSNLGRNLCLAVRDGKIANDSPLITWDCIPGDASQIFYSSNGMYHVGSQNSNFCMASYDNPAHAGSRVGVWQCNTADPTQRFYFGASADIDGPNNLCVGVADASNVRGSAVILWTCQNRTSIGVPNQAWQSRAVQNAASVVAPQTLPSLAVTKGTFGITSYFYYQGVTYADPTKIPGAKIDRNTGILVDSDGKPLWITFRVISNDGGSLVAAGAGNLVAAGAGNLVAAGAGNIVAAGAGNIVAAGAGNLVAAGAGNFSVYSQLSPATLARIATTNIMVNNGANILVNNGANIMVNNGANAIPTNNANSYKIQSVTPTLAAGNCTDANMTKAVWAVTAQAPRSSGNTGDCTAPAYSSYRDLVMKVGTASNWPRGTCRNSMITQATLDVRGVLPANNGDVGECDARRFTQGQWAEGQWPSYAVLVGAVKAYYGIR
jgi:hypothetical protein